jgi:signal peptidase II
LTRKQPTWLLVFAAIIIVAADQLSKWLVVSRLALYESWAPIAPLEPYLVIMHTSNTGAAFGMFPQGNLVFTVIGVVVSLAIVYYFHQLPAGGWWVRVALGLQLGGAIGNLVDRLRQGYVIDFIRVFDFPVFNIADSSIVVGVGILILLMILEDIHHKDSEQPQEVSDEAKPA